MFCNGLSGGLPHLDQLLLVAVELVATGIFTEKHVGSFRTCRAFCNLGNVGIQPVSQLCNQFGSFLMLFSRFPLYVMYKFFTSFQTLFLFSNDRDTGLVGLEARNLIHLIVLHVLIFILPTMLLIFIFQTILLTLFLPTMLLISYLSDCTLCHVFIAFSMFAQISDYFSMEITLTITKSHSLLLDTSNERVKTSNSFDLFS